MHMKIDFELDRECGFFDPETRRALDWLLQIRDEKEEGWAWVQFIRPNEQNTAEVISTFIDYIDELDEGDITNMVDSVNKWLLDTGHAKISIDYCWVLMALQKVRECERISSRIDGARLEAAIKDCLDWLCKHRNNVKYTSISQLEEGDGVKGCGWGDNDQEISGSIRTSLALIAIYREISYLTRLLEGEGLTQRQREETAGDIERYSDAAQIATEWLLSIQNSDGGWGNIDKRSINSAYETRHNFSYSDLLYQCNSNPASTGYAMIALTAASDTGRYRHILGRAADYLRRSRKENGGWTVFSEIGVRDGQRYTFRHFSTAWALQALIISRTADFNDECVIDGFAYMTTLQDENYGGWKSSSNADNYTWATCNALDTIKLFKNDLSRVAAKEFLKIVCEWWDLKKKDTSFSITIKKKSFAFNGPMCLLFCLVFSVTVSLMLYICYDLLDPMLAKGSEEFGQMVYSVLVILAAAVLGLPWIVYVKNVFHREQEGWLDSIGWVYGIITGFVIVLYQFII